MMLAAWEAKVGSWQPMILGQPSRHSKTPSEKNKHDFCFSSVKIVLETSLCTLICVFLLCSSGLPVKCSSVSVKEVRIFDEYKFV